MDFNSWEERYRDFLELCSLNNFTLTPEMDSWLKENGFFTSPASTKYHGAYDGGLYDHSRAVYERLVSLTKNNHLAWQREQSPFIVGMFHDLCKCDQYIKKPGAYLIKSETLVTGEGLSHYEYNTNTTLEGHGSKSVMLLSALMQLTEEEMLCIRYHMGAYGNEQEQKKEWAGFDKAIRQYETVLWGHQADQLASKVDDV